MSTRTLPRATDPRGLRPNQRRKSAEHIAREMYPNAREINAHFHGRDLIVDVYDGKGNGNCHEITGEVDG